MTRSSLAAKGRFSVYDFPYLPRPPILSFRIKSGMTEVDEEWW